ncbi:MAG: hypothetical protein DRJ40_05490 [Thermoprotei archaeon]|nr:MAG: hypothetical protein DRJ40_04035 [Thermoprotei archaeon]RLE56846.1 MAG: hypothetical protein DRJ40_05490 [Thermoprotei archaeon]
MLVIEPRFVDRERELETLRELASYGSPLPIYLYGPEGCGKTRLLREFIKRVHGVTIYIDALERRDPETAIVLNPVIEEVRKFVREVALQAIGPLGTYLADRITLIVEKIAEKVSIEGRSLIVIVDDITRAIGLDRVEWYVKWLYELIGKLHRRYSPKSILIVATTSEGKSLDLVMRHTYTVVKLIWNLPREPFYELVQELKPPNLNLREELWRVTGGNPRALIEIAHVHRWDIGSWLNTLERRLTKVLTTIRSRNLENELMKAIEDPDTVHTEATPRTEQLQQILTEENLLIYKYVTTLHNTEVPSDLELGIGKYYAWQIPAYRDILKKLLIQR